MKKISIVLSAIILSLSLIGCGQADTPKKNTQVKKAVVTDPSGQEITLPDKIESVIVLAPAVSETLISLGCADKIVACDAQSATINNLPEDLPSFDMMKPDTEQLLSLNADVLFVSNLTMYNDEDPFKELTKAGTSVICVPSATSIKSIKEQTKFIAETMNKEKEGKNLVKNLNSKIEEIKKIGDTVTNKKKVYFEISAAPEMYSFGSGTFLNELISIIGAENILADEKGWMPVEPEIVVNANPDVILTNVNYTPDPINEILNRPGFESVNAVKNKNVFYIDNNASSRPNCNIIKALDEMADCIYPDLYN